MGIFVGNKDPDLQTFNEIIPKMKKRLNFWKPLKLPILAKARVIEIFHASKLFYAANFYPIPQDKEKEITEAFMNYITFPKRSNEVSRTEMEKLRIHGGIKLINIKLKAETPKVHWLIRLLCSDHLRIQRSLFNTLIGAQGPVSGEEIIFTETPFVKKCKIKSSFYKEALLAISKLHTFKHYADVNGEHLFYNPIFVTDNDYAAHDRTITPFRGNAILCRIRTYGDILNAENTITQPRLLAAVRRKIASINHIRDSAPSHMIIGLNDGKEHGFRFVTQKLIYSELLHAQSRDHAYVGKWSEIVGLVMWDPIWDSLHQQFFTESTKSTIWEQIHLNFYTTHNYNKWHNALDPCPLCRKIPENASHIMLSCKFTKVMWRRIHRSLVGIIPSFPTSLEMAFGLQPANDKDKYPTTLRNWLTFSLRHLIMQEERTAFHAGKVPSIERFFVKYNNHVKNELKIKKLQYDFQGLSTKFEKIVTTNNIVAKVDNGKYTWNDIL